MNRKIIVNHKEFKMEKMSADTYMEYLELAEQIDAAISERASKRYSRQEIEAMMLFICKAYGNQFTVDELKDAESGLDAAGIVIEFNMILTVIFVERRCISFDWLCLDNVQQRIGNNILHDEMNPL